MKQRIWNAVLFDSISELSTQCLSYVAPYRFKLKLILSLVDDILPDYSIIRHAINVLRKHCGIQLTWLISIIGDQRIRSIIIIIVFPR